MRLFCRRCGERTDGRERLGAYCPGARCGTHIRRKADTTSGVRAWCEPERQRGDPGRTATARLSVCNAGEEPATYRVVPLEPVEGRLVFDASAFATALAPGETRSVDVHYMPPRDRVAMGLDVATRFGIPTDADAGPDNRRFGVALRVVGTGLEPVAACAAFAIDTTPLTRTTRPPDPVAADTPTARARPRARRALMLLGGLALALAASAGLLVNAAANGDGGRPAPAPSVARTLAPDEHRLTGASARTAAADPHMTAVTAAPAGGPR